MKVQARGFVPACLIDPARVIGRQEYVAHREHLLWMSWSMNVKIVKFSALLHCDETLKSDGQKHICTEGHTDVAVEKINWLSALQVMHKVIVICMTTLSINGNIFATWQFQELFTQAFNWMDLFGSLGAGIGMLFLGGFLNLKWVTYGNSFTK